MGKKWRSPSQAEKGCSDKEELGRRRSRSASRGRFAESWKRLSSRQGSTKRSGLASQQPPVSRGCLGLVSLWRPFLFCGAPQLLPWTPFSPWTCRALSGTSVERGSAPVGQFLSSRENWRLILTGRGRELGLLLLRQIKARGGCSCAIDFVAVGYARSLG